MKKDLIKIFEFDKNDELFEYIKAEFTKNNILYEIQLIENWEGIKVAKYIPKFIVYVQKKKIDEAKEIIEKFYAVKLNEDEQLDLNELEANPNYDIEKDIKNRNRKNKIIIAIMFLPIIILLGYAIISAFITFFQTIFQN